MIFISRSTKEIAKMMFEIFLTIKHLHSINIVHGG